MLDDPPYRAQIASMINSQTETLARVEVLADLEEVVHKLMEAHEAKRILWFPSELLSAPPDTDPDTKPSSRMAQTVTVQTNLVVPPGL